jgi:hypothetical protein
MVDILEHLMAWAQKDAWVILVCALTLLGCLYTMATIGSYQRAINAAWEQQWDRSGCKDAYVRPNITFNYKGVYENATAD